MSDIGSMRERHILRYESQQRHLDELLARARERTGEGPEHADVRTHLEALETQRDTLAGQLDELKLRDPSDWQEEEIEKAGPMGIWDAVAEQAEKLVERLEKK